MMKSIKYKQNNEVKQSYQSNKIALGKMFVNVLYFQSKERPRPRPIPLQPLTT